VSAMGRPMTRSRGTYLQLCILALLFAWVVYYQTGPALVQFQRAWSNNHSSADRVLDPIFDLVVPLFAIGFGFAVAVLKPRDVKAWLLLGLLLSFAEILRFGPPIKATPPWLGSMARSYQSFGTELWLVWFFLFLIYFPARMQIDARWPWLKWAIIVPYALNALSLVGRVAGFAAFRGVRPGGALDNTIEHSFLGLLLTLLSARYFMAETADQRRRLRLFYWGTLVTLLPGILLTLWAKTFHHTDNFSFAPEWLVLIAVALLAFFPAVLAYVIVVQRAMDVRVVVRQGIRYALAKRGLNVLRAMIIIAFIYVMVALTQRHAGLWPQVFAIAVGIVVINGIRSMADNARKWIDKRFFRDQLRAEELLGNLANDVHRIIHTDELMRTVAHRVASSLHIDSIAVWFTDGGGLTPAYATNADGWNVGLMLAELREIKKPLLIHDEKIGSGAEVAVPLMARDEMLGTMVLGTKRSEEPYSRMELDVLETVGSQTGLALDNSRLATSLAQEAAQRERMNREMEIAREVQQGLLPQDAPSVMGLEYGGLCRPALGVGGDYYDFLQLCDGRFGFAIGDVSGKGFAAALLMASLQASLRGQTLDATDDLAAVLTRMNKLLFEATAPNRYATFFYAQYDPLSRKLTWVNAGHNAPLLLRDGKIRKLDEGGPVIGLLPEVEYQQASTHLARGDVLVAYTDGISEAMNANSEEWGEERLYAAVTGFEEGLPAQMLLGRLLECADAHAAGAPQHDDMTVVALRVLPFA
jgi:phosphoserine phosphatase RsbU/P